jgi:hypothetical protein
MQTRLGTEPRRRFMGIWSRRFFTAMMTKVFSMLSSRIISLRSDSSEIKESSSKNHSIMLMDKLINKSTHQHQKRMEELDQIDANRPEIHSLLRHPICSIPAATAVVAASGGEQRKFGITRQRRGVSGGARIQDRTSGRYGSCGGGGWERGKEGAGSEILVAPTTRREIYVALGSVR